MDGQSVVILTIKATQADSICPAGDCQSLTTTSPASHPATFSLSQKLRLKLAQHAAFDFAQNLALKLFSRALSRQRGPGVVCSTWHCSRKFSVSLLYEYNSRSVREECPTRPNTGNEALLGSARSRSCLLRCRVPWCENYNLYLLALLDILGKQLPLFLRTFG